MGLERSCGLVDQRGPVGEEQHPLDPVDLHQLVDQRDHRAGLSRSGRHDQQRLALLIGQRGVDGLDGAGLVIALDDGAVDGRGTQRKPGLAALDQQFELVAGVEALELARRIAGRVVPDPVLVAVGIEHHGTAPELRLQAVGVQLRLLLADLRTLGGPFRLDHRQRQRVSTPQHVVDEARAVAVGHPGDRVLLIARLVQQPPGLGEHDVDEQPSGLGLGVVVVVGLGVRSLSSGDLGFELAISASLALRVRPSL